MRAGPGFECQLFRASRAWGVRARPREGAESRDSGNTGSERRVLQLRLGPRDVPSLSVDLGGGERRRSAQVCWRRFHPIVFSYQTKGTFLLKCFVCGAASKEHRVIEGGEKK